jgi:hypothetical protein
MTPPTPQEAEIAGVAARLTKAQREAVLALHGDGYKSWPAVRLRLMMDSLGKHGLAEMRVLGLAQKGPPWFLTPLGLAVRQHLTRAQGEDCGRED